MKLLVLTPLVPSPPHDGDKLRLHHFLRELKRRGHTLDLFCLTRVGEDLGQVQALRPLCRRIHLERLTDAELALNFLGGALLGRSLNLSSHFSPKLRDAVEAYWKSADGKSVDAVLAHRLRMAPLALEGNPGVPVVLDLTDCLGAYTEGLGRLPGAPWLSRLRARWDHGFLRQEEVEWGGRAAATVVISGRDARALRAQGLPESRLHVVPNGVPAVPRGKKWARPSDYPAGRPVVSFIGNMGYFPNEDGFLWFYREVWPRVKGEVPDAFLAAVGGRPGPRLKRLEKPGEVRVTGWVEEVEPYVAGSALTVAPLRVAAGMQNKVALSLSLGVPVAATSAAADWWEGERPGLWAADDPGEMARAVVGILKRPAPARAQARRGGAALLKNLSWADAGGKLERVLRSVAGRKKP